MILNEICRDWHNPMNSYFQFFTLSTTNSPPFQKKKKKLNCNGFNSFLYKRLTTFSPRYVSNQNSFESKSIATPNISIQDFQILIYANFEYFLTFYFAYISQFVVGDIHNGCWTSKIIADKFGHARTTIALEASGLQCLSSTQQNSLFCKFYQGFS